jgi:hypothetical protein
VSVVRLWLQLMGGRPAIAWEELYVASTAAGRGLLERDGGWRRAAGS